MMPQYVKSCFSAHSDWLMCKVTQRMNLKANSRCWTFSDSCAREANSIDWGLALPDCSSCLLQCGSFLHQWASYWDGWFWLGVTHRLNILQQHQESCNRWVIQWKLMFFVLPHPKSPFVLALLGFCTWGWAPFTPTKQQTKHSDFWHKFNFVWFAFGFRFVLTPAANKLYFPTEHNICMNWLSSCMLRGPNMW